MKWPHNGSMLANASLLAIGAVAGAAVSWWAIPTRPSQDDFAASLEGGPIRRPSARTIALNERAGGPTGSEEAKQSLRNALERSDHFRNAGKLAAEAGIVDALAEAEHIGSEKDRADFIRGIYASWSETDAQGALAHALGGFAAGSLQSDTIGIAINKWGSENPREAWLWAEANLSGPLLERALTDVIIGWARRSPEDAAGWLGSTGLTSQTLFNALPGTWAETDPNAALAWADSLPPGKARDTAEIAVANSAAQDDPAETAKIFEDRIADGKNPGLPITIANIWAGTDPAAAAEWVTSMEEGPGKTEAAATLATVWAASDIQAAVAWSQSIGDADMRRQVVSNIGTTWGAIEPEAALDWLGSLPKGLANDGITGAMYSWAGTDPVGMREWIDAAGNNPLGDRARQSLGDVLSQEAIPDALDLALGMKSAVARDAALARYFREWRKRDDASAQDWLDANWAGLPATTQGALAKVQTKAFYQK
ncbi:MAG: hypothetical protein H7A50_10755 [Akkermansiaceae bacterium]|nr:hypothetical protein [Akkermansiaceae bacterium]